MARPRIFVSSTFYDLKHIRSSLDIFIDSLGYDSILSEKGDVAYAHDISLDESCYREVSTADIFVLIIGGRYGSPSSRESEQIPTDFYERYKSVTNREHDAALSRDIPIFILVESAVYAEFKTYLRNKEEKSIRYAHVDSVNVFHLLEEILSRRKNNPLQTFERFADIENWLRDQWAGLFREYLHRSSAQLKLAALTEQINLLQEVANTLKKYLETLVTKVSPDASSAELIREEDARLEEARSLRRVALNPFISWVVSLSDALGYKFLTTKTVSDILRQSESFADFCMKCRDVTEDQEFAVRLAESLYVHPKLRLEVNDAREMIGKEIFVDDRKNMNYLKKFIDDYKP